MNLKIVRPQENVLQIAKGYVEPKEFIKQGSEREPLINIFAFLNLEERLRLKLVCKDWHTNICLVNAVDNGGIEQEDIVIRLRKVVVTSKTADDLKKNIKVFSQCGISLAENSEDCLPKLILETFYSNHYTSFHEETESGYSRMLSETMLCALYKKMDAPTKSTHYLKSILSGVKDKQEITITIKLCAFEFSKMGLFEETIYLLNQLNNVAIKQELAIENTLQLFLTGEENGAYRLVENVVEDGLVKDRIYAKLFTRLIKEQAWEKIPQAWKKIESNYYRKQACLKGMILCKENRHEALFKVLMETYKKL